MSRLAATLDRFGDAVEADFAKHYPGEDVRRLWQSRQWRRLLNLIDHLPGASFYGEAQADDEEIARAYLAQAGDESAEVLPRVSEWDPNRATLVNIEDRLGEIISVVVAIAGGKAEARPRPRPKTAIDRVQDEQKKATHQGLVSRLLPGR